MNEITAINLLRIGANHKVRHTLKKLAIEERMQTLHRLLPYIKETPAIFSFFHKNFALEIGALLSADYDYVAATRLYRDAKDRLRFTP